MAEVFENFTFHAQQAQDISFSLKGSVSSCCDSIDLPVLECKTGWFITLSGSFSGGVLGIVKEKLLSFTVSVSDTLLYSAKRVLRRAVAGVRHFVCSNQRGKRRVAPLVPMALRL